MILYYLFCSPEEEGKLNEEGLEYLVDDECEIIPGFRIVNIGDKKSVVDAIYTASIYGGYIIISEEEYNKYKNVND